MNWSNRTPPNPIVLYGQREAWHRATLEAIMLARQSPAQRGFPRAQAGEVRPVWVWLHRNRSLDRDAEAGTVKPILDRMGACWRKRVGKHFVKVPGPGLIYDDDKRHLPKGALEVEWVPAPRSDQRVVVTVTIN